MHFFCGPCVVIAVCSSLCVLRCCCLVHISVRSKWLSHCVLFPLSFCFDMVLREFESSFVTDLAFTSGSLTRRHLLSSFDPLFSAHRRIVIWPIGSDVSLSTDLGRLLCAFRESFVLPSFFSSSVGALRTVLLRSHSVGTGSQSVSVSAGA